MDKIGRIGLRVQGPVRPGILSAKIEGTREAQPGSCQVFNRRALEADRVTEELLAYADAFAPLVADTGLLLNDAPDADQVVLLEGSLGTLLDIDHGTYPFVTSSNPTSGGLRRLQVSGPPASRGSSAS